MRKNSENKSKSAWRIIKGEYMTGCNCAQLPESLNKVTSLKCKLMKIIQENLHYNKGTLWYKKFIIFEKN